MRRLVDVLAGVPPYMANYSCHRRCLPSRNHECVPAGTVQMNSGSLGQLQRNRLVTVCADRTLRMWPLRIKELLAAAAREMYDIRQSKDEK